MKIKLLKKLRKKANAVPVKIIHSFMNNWAFVELCNIKYPFKFNNVQEAYKFIKDYRRDIILKEVYKLRLNKNK